MSSDAPNATAGHRHAGLAPLPVLLLLFTTVATPVEAAGDSALAECAAAGLAADEVSGCLELLAAEVEDELAGVQARAEGYFAGLDAVTGNQRGSRTLAQSRAAFVLFRELDCELAEIDQGIGQAAVDHGLACRIDHDRNRIASLHAMIGESDAAAPGAGSKPAALEPLTDSAWRVVEVAGEATEAEIATTFEIDSEGEISGSGGCNSYFGSAEVDTDGALGFRGIGTTRMACADPVMAQENRYLAALEEVAGFTLGDGTLEFTAADATVLVRLERQRD